MFVLVLSLFVASQAPLLPTLAPPPVTLGGEQRSFAAPVRLLADGKPIRTAAPGYAAPTLHDVNGDGHRDLVVGQLEGGRLRVHPGNADGGFGAGSWLEAGGEVAEVPGVW
ncbi:hypothetical protein Pla163_23930 [Planctomycetes bacterium Pla163]|uniref:FG-GAP repeat protein n=1 Tax=Rohdeia mirabilis TaxID=2528008 RepID=A0A518D1F4_9BACT|nr:hypothetical protein Pla163_23930 [Planctomycetes bacterium Pla163]